MNFPVSFFKQLAILELFILLWFQPKNNLIKNNNHLLNNWQKRIRKLIGGLERLIYFRDSKRLFGIVKIKKDFRSTHRHKCDHVSKITQSLYVSYYGWHRFWSCIPNRPCIKFSQKSLNVKKPYPFEYPIRQFIYVLANCGRWAGYRSFHNTFKKLCEFLCWSF